MYYEILARCAAQNKKCIRMIESRDAISCEDYDALRVRAGMVSMLRTIRRVGMPEVYTQAILDRSYLRNSLKCGFPL